MDEYLVARLMESLHGLEEANEEYQRIIRALTEENRFLAETITTNRIGRITAERRELKSMIREKERECTYRISEAIEIKNKFETDSLELNKKLQAVMEQQADIMRYIDIESERKTAEIKSFYQHELSEHIAQNDSELQKMKAKYRNRYKVMICVTICGVAFGIISTLINCL